MVKMPASTTEVSPQDSHSVHSLLHPIATQDIQCASPTSITFEVEKPRGRRRSRSPPPVATRSVATAPSKAMYSPPVLTWRNAFQDAKAGVYYTKDAFPSSSFIPPPFSREPVSVDPAERVELLDEADDYAVRVRVLRTGTVGLIPAWNIEGALERLTRINTAFNEAATCPVEARAMMRRDSESSATSWDDDDNSGSPTDTSLTHIHARCIPFATRVRFPDYYGASSPFSDGEDDSDSDAPPPAHERGRPFASSSSQPGIYQAQPHTLEKGGISISEASSQSERSRSGGRKSVNFAAGERPLVVFRYPSEDLFGAFLEDKAEGDAEDQESGSGEDEAEDEDENEDDWWWYGWEEPREDAGAPEDRHSISKMASAASELAGMDRIWTTFEGDEMIPFFFDLDDDRL